MTWRRLNSSDSTCTLSSRVSSAGRARNCAERTALYILPSKGSRACPSSAKSVSAWASEAASLKSGISRSRRSRSRTRSSSEGRRSKRWANCTALRVSSLMEILPRDGSTSTSSVASSPPFSRSSNSTSPLYGCEVSGNWSNMRILRTAARSPRELVLNSSDGLPRGVSNAAAAPKASRASTGSTPPAFQAASLPMTSSQSVPFASSSAHALSTRASSASRPPSERRRPSSTPEARRKAGEPTSAAASP
mmetsp:Transcript_101946/g.283707  ORF Transcript_101946/g.283707 Transcript_101946/m.283707 type:complete len:249 (+) Transcript_101946:307-1053(+)